MLRYSKGRADAFGKNGYTVLPVESRGKAPAVSGWQKPDYIPPDGFGGYSIGVKCGVGEYPIAALDIDVTDEILAEEMRSFVDLMLDTSYIRIGRAPKMLIVFRYDRAGVRKKTSAEFTCGKIEVLGAGQQFVAFGTHPDTGKDYAWPKKSIWGVPARGLPVISEADVDSIIEHYEAVAGVLYDRKSKDRDLSRNQGEYDPDDPLDAKPPIGLPLETARGILSKLDPDCNRSTWFNVAAALHHEYRGSDEAFQVWDEWSARGTKYKEHEMPAQWQSLARGYNGEPKAAPYLLKLAKDNGISVRAAKTKPAERDAVKPEDSFEGLNGSISRFRGSPEPVEMVIDGMLPKGIVSMLYSAGGVGKSTIALNMAVKIALANKYVSDFIGHPVRGGRVAIITAEDPDHILHNRFVGTVRAVAEEYELEYNDVEQALLDNLYIISTVGKSLPLFSVDGDALVTTEHYDSLMRVLTKANDLQLVTIDTKTRYSPAEGMGNVTATQEITHYENMARVTGASVMLLHHTNKASRDGSQTGAQAFRDATATFDSVRAAWYLRGCTDAELAAQGINDDTPGRYLVWENSKNNYTAVNPTLIVKRIGYRYAARVMKKTSPRAKNEAKKRQVVEDALEVLRDAPMAQGDLARCCGTNAHTGPPVFEEMVQDGLISRTKSGKAIVYALTETGRGLLREELTLTGDADDG
jgi:RecA-family ATPase